jgi:DNA-binding transcriptional regulator YhcF (GntR family)
MIYGLGPRARRVFTALQDRIARGDWPPGTRLPSHRDLAVEFGVAPLTVRQVLSQLEEQGLVSRQVGRGTFVRQVQSPAILIVEADAQMAAFLAEYVRRAGFSALTVTRPADALALVANDPTVLLVLSDLHLPSLRDGTALIRALRQRWPQLPVAAMVTTLDDLADLFGSAEWPLQIVPKPITLGLLDDLLHLVGRRPNASS